MHVDIPPFQQAHTELQEQPPRVVWMESDTGKAGSCDMASISVLDQTHALGRMESHGLQHKPWTGQTIFDQLLSRNISMQRFHNDRN